MRPARRSRMRASANFGRRKAPCYGRTRMRLGEMLVRDGRLTEAQLEQALAAQAKDGGRLGTVLFEHDLVDLEALTVYLGLELGIPIATGAMLERAKRAAVRLLQPAQAFKYKVVPLVVQDRQLIAAVEDPHDFASLEALNATDRLPRAAARRARGPHLLLHRALLRRGAAGAVREVRRQPARRRGRRRPGTPRAAVARTTTGARLAGLRARSQAAAAQHEDGAAVRRLRVARARGRGPDRLPRCRRRRTGRARDHRAPPSLDDPADRGRPPDRTATRGDRRRRRDRRARDGHRSRRDGRGPARLRGRRVPGRGAVHGARSPRVRLEGDRRAARARVRRAPADPARRAVDRAGRGGRRFRRVRWARSRRRR